MNVQIQFTEEDFLTIPYCKERFLAFKDYGVVEIIDDSPLPEVDLSVPVRNNERDQKVRAVFSISGIGEGEFQGFLEELVYKWERWDS